MDKKIFDQPFRLKGKPISPYPVHPAVDHQDLLYFKNQSIADLSLIGYFRIRRPGQIDRLKFQFQGIIDRSVASIALDDPA